MIEQDDAVETEPKMYIVVDYIKQTILPGEPTPSLIQESYKTEIGKVNAVCTDEVWRPAVGNEPGVVVYVDTIDAP